MSEDDIIYANFQPSDTKLLKNSNNNQLLIDNPILTSILSKIFPYLLILDNFLEILTWTNDDAYTNVLLLIIYSIIVNYWSFFSYFILPILIGVSFAYVVWIINSIIYDTKYNEKPTIDEILHTLHNITVRFEMLLSPIKRQNFKRRNFFQLIVVSCLLTPLHLIVVYYIVSPRSYLWLSGLFLLTYHSPWSYSIRRLLWRSIYIRIFIFYLTGLDIKLNRVNKDKPIKIDLMEDTLSGFQVLEKHIESPTKLNQIIQFTVLENERRWLGIGWSHLLLPSERSNYCFENTLAEATELSRFQPPVFSNDLYDYTWEWLDQRWIIDKEFSKDKNNGWVYYDNNWENLDYSDGFSKFTRSRKWTRKAKLVIDKKAKVYDE